MDKKRMKEALELLQDSIPLCNNKDAFLWDVADWGLGNIEKPDPENYNEPVDKTEIDLHNKIRWIIEDRIGLIPNINKIIDEIIKVIKQTYEK